MLRQHSGAGSLNPDERPYPPNAPTFQAKPATRHRARRFRAGLSLRHPEQLTYKTTPVMNPADESERPYLWSCVLPEAALYAQGRRNGNAEAMNRPF